MIDLYLRLPDEAAWQAQGVTRDPALLIDVVGIIRKPIQQWTEDGEQVMRKVPGFHVNVRCTDDRDLSALEPFAVEVDTPARVWAA